MLWADEKSMKFDVEGYNEIRCRGWQTVHELEKSVAYIKVDKNASD